MELGSTFIGNPFIGYASFPTKDPAVLRLIELAWCAGFVDGEGCIHISKTKIQGRKNPTYRLVLSIVQNHIGSLKRVARALGQPDRFYTVKRSVGMNRDAFALNICDQNAHRSLKLLLPYLARKAPEAQVAIEAYEAGQMNIHPGAKGHELAIWEDREWYYKKLRRMK